MKVTNIRGFKTAVLLYFFLYIFINNCRCGVSKTVELTAWVESLPAGWAQERRQPLLSASRCSPASFPRVTSNFGTFPVLSVPAACAGIVVAVLLRRSWTDTSSSLPVGVINRSCIAKDPGGCCSAGLRLDREGEA